MDWGKAKSILIVALLITNIFFLCTYIQLNKEQKETLKGSNVIELLEKHGITLNTSLPKWHSEWGLLEIEYLEIKNSKLTIPQSARASFDINDELPVISSAALQNERVKNLYLRDARQVLKYLEVTEDTYRLTEYRADIESVGDAGEEVPAVDVELKFEAIYNEMSVDGLYFILRYRNDELVDIDYKWYKSLHESRKYSTIPPEAALVKFMGDFEGKKATIEDIRMMYKVGGAPAGTEPALSDTAAPVWRITLKNGEVFEVDGFGL